MCILFYRSYSLPPPSSLRFVYFFGERLYHFFCRAISVGMFCCFRASSIRWPGEKGAQQQQEEVWRMARGACIVAFSSWRWQKKRNAERTWPPVNGAMCPVSTHAGCGTARKPHDAVQRLSSDNELLTLKTLRVQPPPRSDTQADPKHGEEMDEAVCIRMGVQLSALWKHWMKKNKEKL